MKEANSLAEAVQHRGKFPTASESVPNPAPTEPRTQSKTRRNFENDRSAVRDENSKANGTQKASHVSSKSLANEIRSAAEKVRKHDSAIRQHGLKSTIEAEHAGNLLAAMKSKLKLIKPKIGFQEWIESACKISYRSANNYMRVANEISKDSSLRELGLTEVYVALGLVTRSSQRVRHEHTSEGLNAVVVPAQRESDDSFLPERVDGKPSKIRPSISIGRLNAQWSDDRYLIEVEADWRKSIPKALRAKEFEALLSGAGVTLRLKTPDENRA